MKLGRKILQIFLFIIGIFIALFLYSKYVGTKGLAVKEYKITNESIPENFHGVKLVQFSDIHYGTTINYKDLQKIVKKINALKPDIVVFTGDLFDKSISLGEKDLSDITKAFSSIQAELGKYAIAGDNDSSHKNFETILTNSDFINLNDTYDYIYSNEYTPIILSGLSSRKGNKEETSAKLKTSIEEITKYNVEKETPLYSILLMHEPDEITKVDQSYYKLVLAGHSLGGSIHLPFVKNLLLEDGAKTYNKDFYDLGNSQLYISNGLGTSSFTYRFLNTPSINLFRLTNK
ncbi:MAG: metallophosphoesterase [Bacilli bacterium]|nr:metallophosphoesterase [Bacilli bacterium]